LIGFIGLIVKRPKRAKRSKPSNSRTATNYKTPTDKLVLSQEAIASFYVTCDKMVVAQKAWETIYFAWLSRGTALASSRGLIEQPLKSPPNSATDPADEPTSKPGPPVPDKTADVLVQGIYLEFTGRKGLQLTALLQQFRPDLDEKKVRRWWSHQKENHPEDVAYLRKYFATLPPVPDLPPVIE
jgi:hypothetical protein